MNIKNHHFCFLVLLLCMWSHLQGGEASQQAQQLHKEIGGNLIEIKKNNPALQQTVYTLLDQVGALNRLSSKIIQKRKLIKTAFKEEQDQRITLDEENERLKTKLRDLNDTMAQENSKTAYYQQQCDELAKERTDLITKKAELESKEKEYVQKIKELERASSNKAAPHSVEPPLAFHKPREIIKGPPVNKTASALTHNKINA